jgi:c(7)-type cytochrome triheme protein
MKIKIPKITFWRAVLLVIWTLGLYATIVRFTQGLGASTNLNDQFPWGIWIGFDILVGVGLAAGGFVITGIVYIFNLKEFKPIARPTVLTAYLGYLLVVSALLFDLGLPHHVWHPIVFWNHHSVMFEVGWCVILYTTVLTIEFLPLVLEKFGFHKPLKWLHKFMLIFVMAGVLLSTLHQSSLGTLYVIVPDKLHPLWYTGLLPLLFFISAIAGGLAMVIFESYTSARAFGKQLEFHLLEKLGSAMAVILAVLFAIRLQILSANNALGYMFDGSTESAFFLFEIMIGTIVPIAMLVLPKIRHNTAGLYLASIFVLIGFVMNRLNVSMTGMMGSAGISYFPSWMEVAVTVSIVSLGFVIFRMAAKYLPLFGDETENTAPQPAPLIAAGHHGRKAIVVLSGLLLFVVLGMTYSYANKPEPVEPEAAQLGIPENFDGELVFPAPIKFEMSEESPGQVIFDHETHVDPFEPNCVNCHATEFKILPHKAGARGSVDFESLHENGKHCGSCHNDTDAFGIEDGCEFCHQVE